MNREERGSEFRRAYEHWRKEVTCEIHVSDFPAFSTSPSTRPPARADVSSDPWQVAISLLWGDEEARQCLPSQLKAQCRSRSAPSTRPGTFEKKGLSPVRILALGSILMIEMSPFL